jgi:hypothetical protein
MLVRLTSQSEPPPEGEAKEFPCGDKVICGAKVAVYTIKVEGSDVLIET